MSNILFKKPFLQQRIKIKFYFFSDSRILFKNYIGCVDNVCNDTVGVVGVVKTGIGVEGIC